MARRRHRRRRRYGGLMSIPLGGLPSVRDLNPLGKSVNSTDLIVGIGVALGAGPIVAGAVGKFWPAAPEVVKKNIGPISGVLAGVAASMVMKNRAKGILTGAVITAITPIVWPMVGSMIPNPFAGYVSYPYGMLMDASPMGLLTDVNRVNGLSAYAMAGEDDYSFVP